MRSRELAVAIELLLGLVLLLLALLYRLLVIHLLLAVQSTTQPINFSHSHKIGPARAPKAR